MYVVAVRLLGEKGLKFRTNVGDPVSAAISIEPDADEADEPPFTLMLHALVRRTATTLRTANAVVVVRLLGCAIVVCFFRVVVDRAGNLPLMWGEDRS
jgi:hypothetical protein